MKKQVIFVHWYYILLAIIFSLVFIAIVVTEAVLLITVSPEVNPAITKLNFMIPLSCVILILEIAVIGYYMIQYVVVSEEGIKWRCLWRTIRTLKWEEVKGIRFQPNAGQVGALTSGWFVIDDGVERKLRIGIFVRNSYIVMRATTRAKKVLEQYWHEPIETGVKQ